MTIEELKKKVKPMSVKERFFILGKLWQKGRITRKTFLELLNLDQEKYFDLEREIRNERRNYN
jgi:hypothetical protein